MVLDLRTLEYYNITELNNYCITSFELYKQFQLKVWVALIILVIASILFLYYFKKYGSEKGKEKESDESWA